MYGLTKLLCATVAVCAFASPASAENKVSAHGHHAHHFAAFGGATHGENGNDATAGLEYEYRLPVLSQHLGVGPAVELVQGEHPAELALALAYVHIVAGLKVFAGPGYERSAGHGELVVRAGGGYDVELGHASVTPLIAADRVAGHTAIVGGLAVGYGF